MKTYRQLSFEEREEIALCERQGLSLSEIARRIGRHRSTVWRELKRNLTAKGTYSPTVANGQSLQRRARDCLLTRCEALRTFVIQRLNEGWSPEAISGWLRCGNEKLRYINHESIYAFIYASANRAQKLWLHLRQRKRTRRRRLSRCSKDLIKGKTSIHARSQVVDNRQTFGHWEADYMIFKRHQPLLVLHERKSRAILIAKLTGRTAAEMIAVLMGQLKRLSKSLHGSVTFDNDTGFALHQTLKDALKVETYFCDAYASWQKGGVENSNGRLRYWLPKRMDLDQVSDVDLEEITMTSNLTPRKCLGWKTPLQAIAETPYRKIKLSFA